MYYLETGHDKHRRMRNAVLLAICLHAALLLGLSFQPDSNPYRAPQIEVTLATIATATTPDEARYLAQADQLGRAETAEVAQLTSPEGALSGDGGTGQPAPPPPRGAPADGQQDLVTTAAAARRVVSSEPLEQQQTPLRDISPEVDELTRELASLEAELDEQSRNYTQMPRVRRLTSAATRQSADAAYLLEWRRRVEAVGNKYYPEASVRYGIYGDLRLLVVIAADGSLQDIKVLASSGYAVLDEAAIKIVRMAAPYAPFPAELRATTDRLEIIRTWQFQENRLSSH